jgi:flagellar basal-body rod protein FlgF
MENALLVGLSRQMALAREFEVVANNVANVNTNGFRRRATNFAEHLMPVASADDFRRPDRKISYVIDQGTWLSTARGSIERTEEPLDVAIKGDGFFVLQGPNGQERYTRNGSLAINSQGTLVTSDGKPVLTQNGPVQFSSSESNVAISPDGTITSTQGLRGKLRIAMFDNPQALVNEGSNEFSGGTPRPAEASEIQLEPGAIEKSNVQPVIEMARMIEISRAYSSVSQMMQRTDELRRTAIQRLADLQTGRRGRPARSRL